MLEKQCGWGDVVAPAWTHSRSAYQSEEHTRPERGLKRFDHILRLLEGSDVGKAVYKAMPDTGGEESATHSRHLPKPYQISQLHAVDETAHEGVGDSRDR